MYAYNSSYNTHRTDRIPPTTVKKSVKAQDSWKKSMLDSFENIGIEQVHENLDFQDYYRMVRGDMSFQELSQAIPHLDNLQTLLDGVNIDTTLKHYDLIGVIINAITGKLSDFANKFHVKDEGEVAENEFLRFKNGKIQKHLQDLINTEVEKHLAEKGLDKNGKKFKSEEEKQAYIQKLQKAEQEVKSKDLDRETKKTFKTVGVRWGESTLDQDKTRFQISRMEREELRDKLISGRYFRHHRLNHDSYSLERWHPSITFFSKDIKTKLPQDGEYVGRIFPCTPSEAVQNWGYKMDTKTQKELMGGNEDWKSFVSDGIASGGIQESIENNFNKVERVPFGNYHDHNFIVGLENELEMPLAKYDSVEPEKAGNTYDRYTPRFSSDPYTSYNYYAKLMRNDFHHRHDNCQVTEVFFRAYDLYGYLTYENDFGRIVTEEVTEDILEDFIKENNIKQTFTESLNDIVDSYEVNTLKWVYKPVVYKGLKIRSGNLKKPLYLYCEPNDFQLKGDSEFDVKLPVGGYIGDSLAKKIDPYQSIHNYSMNQIDSLLEKEVGMFFLMDTGLIPSEYDEWGDASEALIALRDVAKDTGIMPVATSGDSQKNQNHFNNFSTHNISYSNEIQSRIQMAEISKQKAWEIAGVNETTFARPTKHETAEGVRQSTEASYAQLSNIFEEFSEGNQGVLELHLGVAQYAQSNKKDLSLMYTKSDASIEFLKESDPQFPLRRLGLIPSEDSNKRKELEEFKTYLLNTNTVGSDTLEIAKLISSDAMTEVMEIARVERKNRQQDAQRDHQRKMQLKDKEAKIQEQQNMSEWKREEVTNKRDRLNNLQEEEIKAFGRASDKKSDESSFERIDEESKEAQEEAKNEREEKSLNAKIEKDKKETEVKEKKNENDRDIKIRELKLRAEELREKQKQRESEEYVAAINKN